ncbi:carboxymuconolactone decarboxylase family protein [Paenibacillus illinoisensis]|uniref:carboxymuconolactone decarboxylase family protein n=1 Tax=Paenibacillus illinoisensis TaxID=59845 RepID=UPI00203FF920|nr:carboxymuconolactone decarboxylase family protein [Paenibacillus illinoisensis]MCM3204272.1 carboxymuconolactone decarboxylase family protein [Paenibacillus illinoisensis]
MPRISYSSTGETPFQLLLGHNVQILKNWNKLEQAFYQDGELDGDLKEQVRRTLAFGNGCKYCQAKGKAALDQKDSKISLAVGFAELFLNHRSSINQATFDVLRQEFSETEIAELCSFICFTTASQMFGAIMDLQPD